MRKLFISYRSSDAAKVDKIALDLSLLRLDDGTARYTTWQDKHNLPSASPNWWDAIVDAIGDNEIFVFNISKASLQSEVCRAELDYAHKLNLPIIPVVLEGEFFLNAKSGKYDIDYWDLVPDWLSQSQLLFYVGAEFYDRFQNAVGMFERSWPRRLPAQRPLNPDSKSVHGSNHAVYDAACDYAERLAFADAEKHFGELVRRNDVDYADVAAQWIEIIRLYSELIEIDERPNSRFLFQKKWSVYNGLFPKEFLEDIFDPKGFAIQRQPTKPTDNVDPTVITLIFPNPTSLDLLPKPFDWIDIPGKGYSIAKYPITNAQYSRFIAADGYNNRKWWTDAGWEAKLKGWSWDGSKEKFVETNEAWTQPYNWTEPRLIGTDKPVVCVSWYESLAFCIWLSDLTSERITLPTEDQWQYGAQGDDNRAYPWGDNWDCTRCNNSVPPCSSNTTTSVRQYEGKGDSSFGAVDMAGNVWQWCLSDYDNGTNDPMVTSKNRILRGGSWVSDTIHQFRCDLRSGFPPHYRLPTWGFRICRT